MKIQGLDLVKKWEENLTWDGILEMEAQGTDVSEIKKRFIERQKAQEEAEIAARKAYEEENKYLNILRFTSNKVEDKNILNKTNISKIESIVSASRNPESQLIKETVGTPPFWGLFGKSKWENNIKESDLLLTSVVQCHPQLWKGIVDDVSPASYLLVYSLNPKYMRNVEVLKKVSKLVNDFRDNDTLDTSKYSANMLKLHEDLDNPESTPHVILDKTLLNEIGINEDSADIRITSNYLYTTSPLPNNKLPSDGILPFIRFREKDLKLDSSFGYATRLIPGKYYE